MIVYKDNNGIPHDVVQIVYKDSDGKVYDLSMMRDNHAVIWELIRSCYGTGRWLNDKPWLNNDSWIN